MDAKWVHKFRIMWIMPSIEGGNPRFRKHVSKNYEKSWNTEPKKLDFDVHSRAKTQLPLFQIYWKCHQLGTKMGFKLVQVGAFETRKLAKVGFGKHDKKTSQKTLRFIQNGPKRGSPKSGTFVVFRGSIPAWSLGHPWGGSRAQKHVKMEARTWIFCFFGTMLSLSLETLWNVSCVPRTTNW